MTNIIGHLRQLSYTILVCVCIKMIRSNIISESVEKVVALSGGTAFLPCHTNTSQEYRDKGNLVHHRDRMNLVLWFRDQELAPFYTYVHFYHDLSLKFHVFTSSHPFIRGMFFLALSKVWLIPCKNFVLCSSIQLWSCHSSSHLFLLCSSILPI